MTHTASVVDSGPAAAWHARAFGSAAADLDLRFEARAPQRSISALLALCLCDADGHPPETARLARWPLARRLHALLAVRLAGDPNATEGLQAQCQRCGSGFELELELARCSELAGNDTPVQWLTPDGQRLQLRLPNAADLDAWQSQGLADVEQLARTLVDTVDDAPPAPAFQLRADWLAPLADVMAEHDPLNALSVDASCPDCDHVQALEIELDHLLLNSFARQQLRLLDEVLRLAQALHWSEAEIVALPAWRRAFYLDRIGAAGALS
ncbi:hypothetical protein [Roseateles sp.]|uniref:hypothetical protein n=1 Tax=Roseateles sp. TaxID=1971397 RepID=UPI00326768E5